jgi:uncharacterized protein involved in exopolysaccharide biosynthesis
MVVSNLEKTAGGVIDERAVAGEYPEISAEVRGAKAPGISVMDILIVLARRWKFLAIATLVIACIGAAVAFLIPNHYTATAVIMPPQQNSASAALMSRLGGMGAMASMAGGALGIKNPNDMYVSLLKLEPVEQAMVDKFGLKAQYHAKNMVDARKKFEKHSAIENGSKDGLIRISVTDHNAQRAAKMANAYVAIFQKYSEGRAITEAAQRRVFFEQQLVQARDNLDNAEQKLKNVEQSKGVVQIGGQSLSLVESAASLRAQIAAKQVEIHAMESYAAKDNPDLRLAKQELAGWQAQLASLSKNQTGGGDGELSKSQMPEVQLLYLQRLRDVKYYETIVDLLAQQFEMAKLDEAREGNRMQIMASAFAPDKKSGPHRGLIILGSLIGGFILVSLWIIFSDGFRNLNGEQRSQVEELVRSFRGRN